MIEALYKNRNTRMSTADRLIEFAARNGLDLTGIPAFKDHVEAMQGQLIPEPSEEPLPQDQAFAQSLAADGDGDEDIFEEDGRRRREGEGAVQAAQHADRRDEQGREAADGDGRQQGARARSWSATTTARWRTRRSRRRR